jgi:predicted RNA-binding Zn ribbon-like protein
MKNDSRAPEPFDLSGGALCLDFANTMGDRRRAETEKLHRPDDLLRWAEETGILDPAERARLRAGLGERPDSGDAALRGALRLREALFRIFSAVARGERPPGDDLAELNRTLAQALRHLRVEPSGERFHWTWTEGGERIEHLLWPVVRSAAELLTSVECGRVRECASDRCTWLFVDRSRTHRRRWCDMKVCGNRAKARRHYERTKKKRASAGRRGYTPDRSDNS